MEWIKVLISGIATFLTFLLGGMDLAVQLLLIVIMLDYITGIIRSAILGKLCSSYGFKGILKKVGILFIVAVSVVIDTLTVKNGAIRTLVIYYFIANECLSIIENLGEAGVPIPQVLKKAILAFKKENDETEDDSNSRRNEETN